MTSFLREVDEHEVAVERILQWSKPQLLSEFQLADAQAEEEVASEEVESRARLDLELRSRADDNAAAMLFVEMLFWTPARMSEDVRDIYCWEVTICLCSTLEAKLCIPSRLCVLI